MKTKYLDNEIELLNAIKRNNELSDYGKEKLSEFNAIKQALTIPVVVQQSEPLKCDQVCDWYSVGHQLNGHQECRTCGKQKAF